MPIGMSTGRGKPQLKLVSMTYEAICHGDTDKQTHATFPQTENILKLQKFSMRLRDAMGRLRAQSDIRQEHRTTLLRNALTNNG